MVKGRQTHGSRPWSGVDPIVAAAQIMIGSAADDREPPASTSRQAAGGRDGRRDQGRHPLQHHSRRRARLVGTIRTFDKDQRTDILQRVERIARATAEANGATATFKLGEDPNPVVFNDPPLTERVLPSLRRAVGEQQVKVLPLITGAEDFAFFAQRVPSVFFFVGVTPDGQDPQKAPANHSPLFYMDEAGLPSGLRSMLHVAVDYLQSGGRSALPSP